MIIRDATDADWPQLWPIFADVVAAVAGVRDRLPGRGRVVLVLGRR